LLLEHLDDDQRKEAKKALRQLVTVPHDEAQPAERALGLRLR